LIFVNGAGRAPVQQEMQAHLASWLRAGAKNELRLAKGAALSPRLRQSFSRLSTQFAKRRQRSANAGFEAKPGLLGLSRKSFYDSFKDARSGCARPLECRAARCCFQRTVSDDVNIEAKPEKPGCR